MVEDRSTLPDRGCRSMSVCLLGVLVWELDSQRYRLSSYVYACHQRLICENESVKEQVPAKVPVPYLSLYVIACEQLLASKLYDIMGLPNKSTTVRELRENKKLSRRKVAQILDIADTTIWRWEIGENIPHLSIDKLKLLLDLYECDFETLYAAFRNTVTLTDIGSETFDNFEVTSTAK
jgi:DNA-binding XRE family transcriptional regulator